MIAQYVIKSFSRHKARTIIMILALVVVTAMLVTLNNGCGDGRPRTYPAGGSVTYGGRAVAGAQVMFLPEAGPPATAITDESGEYQLRTFVAGDGAVPGRHRVTITKNVALPAEPDNPYPETRNELPAKYARPDRSGLTAEVTADGQNEFDFQLSE